ncbi:hypothetical protein [Desulfofundulus australicus]|jgi:hypothetical protein|nr:hypothetical protein [Desulfofundulus australicus]
MKNLQQQGIDPVIRNAGVQERPPAENQEKSLVPAPALLEQE